MKTGYRVAIGVVSVVAVGGAIYLVIKTYGNYQLARQRVRDRTTTAGNIATPGADSPSEVIDTFASNVSNPNFSLRRQERGDREVSSFPTPSRFPSTEDHARV